MPLTYKKLYKGALAVWNSGSLEKAIENCVQIALRETGYEHGTVFIGDGSQLHRMFTTVVEERRRDPRDSGLNYQTFESGKLNYVSAEQIKTTHGKHFKLGYRSIMFIPIKNKKQTIGVLCLLSSKDENIKDSSLSAYSLYGESVGAAISNYMQLEDANSALQIKDRYFSVAIHELKTPLTVVSSYNQLVSRHSKMNKPPKEAWVENINQEVSRIVKLLDELGEGDPTVFVKNFVKDKICFKQILEKAKKNIKFVYRSYKFELEDTVTGESAYIWGDFDKLLQVFINIMGNAAKYSEDTQVIKIQLTESTDDYIVTVEDHGQGIKKENLKFVFKPFYRADFVSKKGMGLGLYVSKRIIDRHYGRIEINSVYNRGTTVTVKLPKFQSNTNG